MTKEQLIKEFREKFGHIQAVKNEVSGNQYTSLEAFLLSAFDAGRASGIEEAKEAVSKAVKDTEKAHGSPSVYIDMVGETAIEILSSLTPSSSKDN